ncbi:exonuclease SbcCD subunit D [Clostridium sp. Ade.TY]|uniref:exonuclease SbcCD subunit D n=1 Tax=Clostridium sp. Ade.TY TaxID=1391647 RepID=UPI00041987F7|nr:exonuclease SbcCD subunit D [Clostridium sp. Ade.TY]
MKIIHTSDWHIGKIVNEFSMIEDQKYMLENLIKLIDEEKPEVLIIAGDMYDRSIPPVEAVELLNDTLNEIVINKDVKVVAISGNHDSGERVSFGAKLLERQGLYIAGKDNELFKKVVIEGKDEIVNFYLIPYKDPAVIKKLTENKNIKSHNDAMIEILNKIKLEANFDEINIIVAHGYVTMYRDKAKDLSDDEMYKVADLEVSESERPLSIGGTELIDSSIFDEFDYVALGHLHGRQKVSRDEVRYSGSLLKYSFSEVKQKKGVTLFNINKNKEIIINLKEFTPIRDLRIIKGNIEELIEIGRSDEKREDYIQAILTDEGEIINPIEKLRAIYPNVMLITREKKKIYDENSTSAKKGYKNKSEKELFKEFYEALGNGEFTLQKEQLIDETINRVLKKEV